MFLFRDTHNAAATASNSDARHRNFLSSISHYSIYMCNEIVTIGHHPVLIRVPAVGEICATASAVVIKAVELEY